jgi:hypothetical protein
VIPCPYPCCGSRVADRDEAWRWHFEEVHRREPPAFTGLHMANRIERCKLCAVAGAPLAFIYFANGCRHVDLGVAMIQHVRDYHSDKVVGWNQERDRLARAMRERRN